MFERSIFCRESFHVDPPEGTLLAAALSTSSTDLVQWQATMGTNVGNVSVASLFFCGPQWLDCAKALDSTPATDFAHPWDDRWRPYLDFVRIGCSSPERLNLTTPHSRLWTAFHVVAESWRLGQRPATHVPLPRRCLSRAPR